MNIQLHVHGKMIFEENNKEILIMKIALTGASSVGKSFLSDHLMKNDEFSKHIKKFITPDARSILDSMECKNTDLMTREDLRTFQLAYYKKKADLEKGESNFLTERSFIDVEAYWNVRDTFDMPINMKKMISAKCKDHAQGYDFHVYLPFGVVPFESDGYRSEDLEFHSRVDRKILSLLNEWNIDYIRLDEIDIEVRLGNVISRMENIHNK